MTSPDPQRCRTCPSDQVNLQFHPYPWCRGCLAQASHLKQDFLPARARALQFDELDAYEALVARIDDRIKSRAGFAPGDIIIRTQPKQGANQ